MNTQKKTLLLFLLITGFITGCQKDDSFSAEESSATTSSSPSPSGSGSQNGSAGLITAGEWNDIDNWTDWLKFLSGSEATTTQDKWNYFTKDNNKLILKDKSDRPVPNAEVQLISNKGEMLWQTKTDNNGTAVLFSSLFKSENNNANRINIKYDNKQWEIENINTLGRNIEKKLDVEVTGNTSDLDLMFVVDATGSMGDEINYLKDELEDVIKRVKDQSSGLNVRMGSVFYRDQNDNYVTRNFPFTTDISSMIDNIKKQSADGGGDFPEAVEAGLEKAIMENEWSENAIGKILFLILDAPPHDNNTVKDKLQSLIKKATLKGIKVIPITASGINKETEFLMRFFAISTNGTYVFITNHSGIGNDHIEATVGPYQVEYLNNLLVRLITKYSVR